jgi:alpha-L-fucosidase
MTLTRTAAEWFTENRLGLFVHWGIYAIPARHEWVMNREEIDPVDYAKYADFFDPDLYDPRAWARAAKAAGMTYAVITTKHHDGFCMWDTATSEYKVTNTPYGRDTLREFVDAFRAEGLRIGLYFSLLDWTHEHFPIDALHPLRNHPDRETINAGRDMAQYRTVMHEQVREILTGYGDIDILFFDYSYDNREHEGIWGGKGAADWGSSELIPMVHELQPGIIVNDRAGLPGAFVTPEEYQPSAPMQVDGVDVPWIGCQTMDGSWGYFREHPRPKSPEIVLDLLIDSVAKGGGLLLNVGPTARGELDDLASDVLAGVAGWMTHNRRSIAGAGATSLVAPPDARYTRRGDRLYLHLMSWPYAHVHLPGLAGKVRHVQFLHDGAEVRTAVFRPGAAAVHTKQGGQPEGTLTLKLPVARPGDAVPVIEIFLTPEASAELS